MIKLVTVLLFGMLSQPVAIATGRALWVDPVLTAIMTTIGGILAVMVILGLGERIKKWRWIAKIHSCGGSKERRGRIYRLLNRFGVPGLGLLAPSLVGAPVGTIIGIVLASPNRALLFWMSIGILIWSAVSAFSIDLGIAGIRALWD